MEMKTSFRKEKKRAKMKDFSLRWEDVFFPCLYCDGRTPPPPCLVVFQLKKKKKKKKKQWRVTPRARQPQQKGRAISNAFRSFLCFRFSFCFRIFFRRFFFEVEERAREGKEREGGGRERDREDERRLDVCLSLCSPPPRSIAFCFFPRRIEVEIIEDCQQNREKGIDL